MDTLPSEILKPTKIYCGIRGKLGNNANWVVVVSFFFFFKLLCWFKINTNHKSDR